MLSNAAQVDQLRWKKFPVLDDGFVCLVDVMGDDQAVVQASRDRLRQRLRPVVRAEPAMERQRDDGATQREEVAAVPAELGHGSRAVPAGWPW